MELNWRTQRQFIIFATYFLIVFIPVFLITSSLLSKTHSCFDGKQNGDETGVDCNGSCQLRCDGTYRDVRVNFVRGVKANENVYDIVALMENFNHNVYFPNIPYDMSIYNTEGKLMASVTGEFFLNPLSKNVILFPGLFMAQEPKVIDLNLKPYRAMSYIGEPPSGVKVENWTAQRGANNSLQVVGELINQTNYEVRNFTVYALLYDDTRTVYAVSSSKFTSILGRQKSAASFTWGNIPVPKQVEFIIVYNE